jgi:hypothetical protein
MTSQRRCILMERLNIARWVTVAWYSRSLSLDVAGEGEQAEHARIMSDRWQAFQGKLTRKLY